MLLLDPLGLRGGGDGGLRGEVGALLGLAGGVLLPLPSLVPAGDFKPLLLERPLKLESSVFPFPGLVDVESLVLLEPGVVLLQGLGLHLELHELHLLQSSATRGPDRGPGVRLHGGVGGGGGGGAGGCLARLGGWRRHYPAPGPEAGRVQRGRLLAADLLGQPGGGGLLVLQVSLDRGF